MRTEQIKKIETKLQLSKYFEQACKNNDLNHAYLLIRARIPISWAKVKEKYNLINKP